MATSGSGTRAPVTVGKRRTCWGGEAGKAQSASIGDSALETWPPPASGPAPWEKAASADFRLAAAVVGKEEPAEGRRLKAEEDIALLAALDPPVLVAWSDAASRAVRAELLGLAAAGHKATLVWVPSQCGLTGNEAADKPSISAPAYEQAEPQSPSALTRFIFQVCLNQVCLLQYNGRAENSFSSKALMRIRY